MMQWLQMLLAFLIGLSVGLARGNRKYRQFLIRATAELQFLHDGLKSMVKKNERK